MTSWKVFSPFALILSGIPLLTWLHKLVHLLCLRSKKNPFQRNFSWKLKFYEERPKISIFHQFSKWIVNEIKMKITFLLSLLLFLSFSQTNSRKDLDSMWFFLFFEKLIMKLSRFFSRKWLKDKNKPEHRWCVKFVRCETANSVRMINIAKLTPCGKSSSTLADISNERKSKSII